MASATPAYQVAVYYFPGWHIDPRSESLHGRGWTEWELLKRAQPRFPNHQQPKRPLWGYEDESDAGAFERKIEAAATHGVNHFIFDWYWYDEAPFLERSLERGFMGAKNNSRLGFALMWANHDWIDLHPAKYSGGNTISFVGATGRSSFDKMTDYVIERYFKHPSYWKIDGCPYFSIYELYRLILGLGGVKETEAALRSFRDKTQNAGFAGLHLNAVTWGIKILPGEKTVQDPRQLLSVLRFDSTTSYVWIHDVEMRNFPFTSYATTAEKAISQWDAEPHSEDLPYFPNVTMGWDPSPRTCQSDEYSERGYPFTPILTGNTPAEFEKALRAAKASLGSQPVGRRILTVNAWNEWTEGSYLEPDTINGMAYLEAIKAVFS